jgi:hypothetical protein
MPDTPLCGLGSRQRRGMWQIQILRPISSMPINTIVNARMGIHAAHPNPAPAIKHWLSGDPERCSDSVVII